MKKEKNQISKEALKLPWFISPEEVPSTGLPADYKSCLPAGSFQRPRTPAEERLWADYTSQHYGWNCG